MKKNQSGFSVLGLLLVLIVLGVVGFAGWYMWKHNYVNNSYKPKNSSSSQKQSSSTNTKDETTDWLTFTPDSKLYSIKLPDGWAFTHQNDECDCLLSNSTVYQAGKQAKVVTSKGGRDGFVGYSIFVDKKDESATWFKDFQSQGNFQAGDLRGAKYYRQVTEQEEALEKGALEYDYYFIKKGQGIHVMYTVNPTQTNQLKLVEESVKTLQ